MKKIIYPVIMLLLLLGFGLPQATAQTGVMHLPDNGYSTYLDTGIELKNDLLNTANTGETGEATLEFWIKSTVSGNQWTLTDINADSGHFSLSMASENQLALQLGTQSHTIDLTNVVASNIWQHIAMVISQNSQLVEIYVNGQKRGQFSLDLSANRQLYFYKQAGDELYITEIRGWTQKRSAEQISDNQWRSFVNRSSTELTSLQIGEGLEVFYGDDDANVTSPMTPIDEVDHTGWMNIQSQAYDAGCISSYEATTLAQLRTDTDHPILNLDKILVTATKGELTNQIKLTWPHIANATQYQVSINDEVDLDFNPDLQNIPISEIIPYYDDDINVLPGEIYTYQVTAFGDNGFEVQGTARGFIFPNGVISGNIMTDSKVFVEGVELRATAATATGSALQFNSGDGPITINNIEVFRDLAGFTLEFWYKGTASPSGRIFQLGGAYIAFDGVNINVTNGDGSTYLSHAAPTDGQWHHYTAVFSDTGGALYQDDTPLVSNATAFSIDLSLESEFSFNASSPAASWELDEFRMWSTPLDSTTVVSRYDHILSGNEAELSLYYRFDLQDSLEVYNQAYTNLGDYIGESDAALSWLAASDQPSALAYGSYTNASGNYTLAAINTGTSPNELTFSVTPAKPNHTFSPDTLGVGLKRSLSSLDYQDDTAHFEDISAMAIAGYVFYRENDTDYPVPQGQSIVLDTMVVAGANSGLVTDAFGAFSISAPLGQHEFSIYNPLASQSMGSQSLYFDGVDDYAQSQNSINFQQNGTFSGWIKRGASTEATQTIMEVGDLQIILKNNQTLAVMESGVEVITAADQLTDDWHFFALSYDETSKAAVLYSGISFYQATLSGPSLNGNLNLGASLSPSAAAFFQGNMHLIEYRDSLYDNTLVEDLRLGDYIEGDEDALQCSFRFTESNEASVRSVSLTPGAQNYVLILDGAVTDTQALNPYTRQSKYDYRADGIYANGEKQVFNVVEPVTGLTFYNDTRYGVAGSIVIPCGYNIGAWDILIERTDALSPPFAVTITGTDANTYFNSDHTVFAVDGLLPGQYRLTLTNQGDPSIELQSGILDITRGWVAQEFAYRSDMSLDVEVVEVVTGQEQVETDDEPMLSLTTEPFDMAAGYCDASGNYIMESGGGYVLSVEVYEQYGTDKCYVEGISYDFGNEDLAHVVAQTAGTGQDTLLIKALEPNFLTPYTRSLQLTASHPENGSVQQNLSAYVTGAKQFSSDFTLEVPPNIVAVVHDPPGDGSSATLSEGTSYSTSESFSHGGGADISIDVSTGIDIEHYTGYFTGAGAGVLGMTKIVDNSVSAQFKVAEAFKLAGGTSSSHEISLNEVITTSSSGDLPGYPSDIYVGYSPIIHMGVGKRLKVENCTPISEDNIDVLKPDRTPMFAMTHQHVKDVTIPNLELLQAATADTDSIQMYQDHIDGWQAILDANEAVWNNAENLEEFTLRDTETGQTLSFENSIAFSAGANLSYSLSDRNSDGSSFTAESNTSLSKTFNKSFSAFGVLVNLETDVKGFYNYSENSDHSSSDGENFSFTLSDNDTGDQFDVLIRKDTTHSFATPVFKAVAGRSMCPVERNTLPREGVELSSDISVAYADLDEQAVFLVNLANTQVANEEAGTGYQKTYKIKVYDSKGAIVRYNGGLLNESGQTVVLETQGDEAIKDSIPLTIERNTATPEIVDFEDVSIVMFSQCEDSEGSLGFYDDFAGVKLSDTLYLSAYFHQPCVEAINISEPAPNWVVNQNSNNQLDFSFSLDNPEASFDNLMVEYAPEGSNVAQLLTEIHPDSLTTNGSGDYTLSVDVSGITDGQYQFRLSPQCGLGSESWREENPSDWISGSIYRISPVITEVYPTDNSIMTSGTISATYDRSLDPAGVNSLNVSLRGILGGYEYVPKSAAFDHIDDQITVPHQDSLNLDGAYTVEFWINPSAYAGNGDKVPVIEKGTNFGVYLTDDGKIDNDRVVSTESLINFKWTHVAVVYDGATTVKTYFDTELVAENTIAPAYTTNTDDLTIGATFLGDAFAGQIDEVRIWNTARSVAELATGYTARLLGNEDYLRAYYVLDDIALDGEGIRDYTGKTSGTVATGISWVEGDAAAPMDVEKVIQDVPVDVILSEINPNQILITPKSSFPDSYIEGAELTAIIEDGMIQDLYGNPAPGTSWSFVVDKNAVQWAANNHVVNQSEGTASNFDMDLSNNGAVDVTYQFNDLPVWLSVSNDPGSGSLPYGFTQTISFEVAEWLNPGKHETYVKATVLETGGGILGVEQFFLEVNVDCPDPGYTFDSNQYPDQISLTASLNIAGEASADENDKVYAYVGNELRGIGQVSLNGGQYLVSMIIYGGFGENSSLDFKVWDASDCKEYQGVIENHSYQSGVNIGSLATPATLTTGTLLSKSLPLPSGYSWVSFNLKDSTQDNLSVSVLSGFNTGDMIITQQLDTLTYNGASNWSGALTALDPKQHYLLSLSQAATIAFQGEAVSENTDIPVAAGITWAGYIPEEMTLTGRAVISLSNTTATNGDQVLGREGFAQFLNGVWIGDLTHLTPGKGYRITAAQAGTLNYFGIAGYSSKATAVKGAPIAQTPLFEIKDQAAQRGWQVNPNSYPEAMYITGVIEDEQINTQQAHIIAAFAGDKCRGVAIPQQIDGKLYYFMTAYGHLSVEEQLSFKLIDVETGKQYLLSNSLGFAGGQSQGSYKSPYAWEIAREVEEEPEQIDGYRLYQSYPNPFEELTTIGYDIPETSQVEISVVDMMGRKLKSLVKTSQEKGSYRLDWYGDDQNGNRLASGVYIIRMQTRGKTLEHKVILK